MPKRPRDANQLAKMIVDISTGELPSEKPPELVRETVPPKIDKNQFAKDSTKDCENRRQDGAK